MKRIGLTGGIGAGKSEVAKILSEYGIPVINLDLIGRAISRKPIVQKKIMRLFGKETTKGNMRRNLREIVFQDAAKRKRLEKLLHPLILKEFNRVSRLHKSEPFIICEAALLIESGFDSALDALIVVSAKRALRLKRLITRDKIPESLAKKMMRAQTSERVRLNKANHVVFNNGNLKQLRQEVEKLVQKFQS
jgi:dephospho-CoA kinase